MEIKYDAYWRTAKATTRVTQGVLTQEDLKEAVRRKEIRKGIDQMPARLSSVNWNNVQL